MKIRLGLALARRLEQISLSEICLRHQDKRLVKGLDMLKQWLYEHVPWKDFLDVDSGDEHWNPVQCGRAFQHAEGGNITEEEAIEVMREIGELRRKVHHPCV